MKSVLKRILKTSPFIYKIYRFIFSWLLKLAGLFVKTDENLILFVVYGGQRYEDSPRFVYEEMKRDPRFKSLKYVWAFQNPNEFSMVPDSEKIKIDTFKYFITALKAKYWITNSSASRGLKFKKASTKNIMFSHGVTGIKKLGRDIHYLKNKISKAKLDFDYIVISGYKDEEKVLTHAWNASPDNKMISTGLPRHDDIVNNLNNSERIKYLKEKLNIPIDKKVILYAPTFREYKRDMSLKNYLTPPVDFDKWYDNLGDEYVLLLTAHYEVEELMNVPKNHPFVINAFKYPFINDLILVSDILISDYSSIIFDFHLTSRPVLSFAYDYAEYSSYRGMYEGYEDLFYAPIAQNENELIKLLKNNEFNIEHPIKEDFLNYGKATTEFINYFVEEIYE